MKPKDRTAPAALLIGAALILLSVISLLSILLPKNRTDGLILWKKSGKLTVLWSPERKDM